MRLKMINVAVNSVQIIGIGDFKTKLLRKNVEEALKSHSGDVSVTNITEINQIKFYAITSTPALIIDGHIVSQGEVPDVEEIKALFEDFQSESKGSGKNI
jgi:protein-disulfide isomerase